MKVSREVHLLPCPFPVCLDLKKKQRRQKKDRTEKNTVYYIRKQEQEEERKKQTMCGMNAHSSSSSSSFLIFVDWCYRLFIHNEKGCRTRLRGLNPLSMYLSPHSSSLFLLLLGISLYMRSSLFLPHFLYQGINEFKNYSSFVEPLIKSMYN